MTTPSAPPPAPPRRRFVFAWLPLALCAAPGLRAAAPLPTVNWQAETIWQDNATNSDGADKIPALTLASRLTAAEFFDLPADNFAQAGAALAGEAWPDYHGLDQFSAGPTLAFGHKFGLGPFAPAVTLEGSAAGVAARETGRGGWTGGLALRVRRRFTSATQLELAARLDRLDTRERVYASTSQSLSARLDHDFNATWRLSLGLAWRNGDVTSYATPPQYDLYAVSRAYDRSLTFGRPLVAYTFGAHALSWSAALSPALTDRVSLSFRLERRFTARGAIHYSDTLLTAGLAGRF